jgi:hypothetical protein
MLRLLKQWQDATYWTSLAGQRFTEYMLIAAYSAVAVLSLIVGLTAKAGTLFGRALDDAPYAARPELKAIMKQFLIASADFSAGASVLVVAAAIVYWGRRAKKVQREALQSQVSSGPPFLL